MSKVYAHNSFAQGFQICHCGMSLTLQNLFCGRTYEYSTCITSEKRSRVRVSAPGEEEPDHLDPHVLSTKHGVCQWKPASTLNTRKTSNLITKWLRTWIDTQMAKRHMTKCSTWLVTREMQTRTTMRYYLSVDRMARNKKKNKRQQVLVKMWRNWTLAHYWWECKMAAATENSMEDPQNMKNWTSCDPVILFLGIYLKELKAES